MLLGTAVDAASVIAGSLVGVFFHNSLPEKLKKIIFQTLGIAVLVLGIQMTLEADNFLIVIFSAIIGGCIGELINLDLLFEHLAQYLKTKIKSKNEKFTEGMVSGFLMFCVGSMTILGAINEGIKGDSSLLLTKAMLVVTILTLIFNTM